jgi:hypothetical protein
MWLLVTTYGSETIPAHFDETLLLITEPAAGSQTCSDICYEQGLVALTSSYLDIAAHLSTLLTNLHKSSRPADH